MEIQTFFLCERVERTEGRTAVEGAGLTHIDAGNMEFPIVGELCYYILLRRASRSGRAAAHLRMQLIDLEGRHVGQPRGLKLQITLPDGVRFADYADTVTLEFPAPGEYRLDLALDEDENAPLYSYDLDVRAGP